MDAAIEWLEDAYDEILEFRNRVHSHQFNVSMKPEGRRYSNMFRPVRDPGLAKLKDDHEGAHYEGRCHKCSQGTLIVIE